MPLNVAVFGYGLSAKVFHLPYLVGSSSFRLVGISTSQSAAAQVVSELTIASTPEALLEQISPDLVVITTPNQTHAALVELALEQGCHVVVEKPLCLDSVTAQRLAELATAKQKLVIPFFNRRWDDDFMALQQVIRQGDLGQIRLFHSRFDRFRPTAQTRWKESAQFGSGVFWDLAPHLIDQMLQLFGAPQTVSADIRALRPDSPCADYFQLCFEYPNTMVHLGSSPYQAGPVCRFDVQGDVGSAQSFGFDPQEQRHREPHVQELPRQLSMHTIHGTVHQPLTGGNYGEFYRLVAQALDPNCQCTSIAQLPTLAEAIVGIQCMEAALDSASKHKALRIRYNEPA